MHRNDLITALHVEPSIGAELREELDRAITDAERRTGREPVVLDAGCGRKSPLVPFRARIARLVGVDLHRPADRLPWLDEFAVADLCREGEALADAPFDVVLSNFTLEHFISPDAAIGNFHAWLRPGGTLVITTVNRRHPFVAAYLDMPDRLRRRLQPLLKASAADAHPLVGACNDPASVVAALERAGFTAIRLQTVPNLARAWGRHAWSFGLGLAGDLVAQGTPSRRSTILAVAHRP
jgi:SAM-dependent methyltransferase